MSDQNTSDITEGMQTENKIYRTNPWEFVSSRFPNSSHFAHSSEEVKAYSRLIYQNSMAILSQVDIIHNYGVLYTKVQNKMARKLVEPSSLGVIKGKDTW